MLPFSRCGGIRLDKYRVDEVPPSFRRVFGTCYGSAGLEAQWFANRWRRVGPVFEATDDDRLEHESLARLVEATYDATVDPQRYEALLQCWETFLFNRSATLGEDVDSLLERMARGDDPHAPAISAHFARAMEIFERLGRARRMEADAQSIADGLPTLGFVVDTRGRVVALNSRALMLTPEDAPDAPQGLRLQDLSIEPLVVKRIEDWIRGRSSGGASPFLLMPCRLGEDALQSCLIATPMTGARVDAESTAIQGPLFLVTSIDLALDAGVVDAFVSAFELSAAEGAVAAALSRGERPADIAESRGASVNTVRSQIKSATKKTGAEGAADLARMFSGFAASFSAARAVGQTSNARLEPHALRRHGAVTLPSGRRIGYIEQGGANGRPAMFLHSLCLGPHWPTRAIEAAARRRWRLIGLWRPGFGDTDPNPQSDLEGTLRAGVSDMRRLLDRLEIERTLLVAHQTSSIYAIRFALAAPERVRGVLCLNHIPVWDDRCLPWLPPRVRLMARTARFAPKLLPFLSRAALAMIDAGDVERLARAIYHGSDHDLRAVLRADVLAPVAEGLTGCVAQGTAAYSQDVLIGLQNYSAEMNALKAPVRVLYGALDQVAPPALFDGAEALAPSLEKTMIDDAGNTLLYTHWQTVLDELERLDAETA